MKPMILKPISVKTICLLFWQLKLVLIMHRHEDDEDDVDDDDDEYDVDDNDQDDNVSGTFAVPASTDYLHLLQHSYSHKHDSLICPKTSE